MTNQEAIQFIQKQIDQIEDLKNFSDSSPKFKQWKKETQTTIKHIFEEHTDNLKDFNNINYMLLFSSDLTTENEFHETYVEGLNDAKAILNAIINEIKQFGIKKKSVRPIKISYKGKRFWTMSNPWVYLIICIAVIVIAGLILNYFSK